jgi:hypothetical protein
VRFVLSVSAKKESSDVGLGTRDSVRVGVQAGSLMSAAHQGICEKCAIASVMARWTVDVLVHEEVPVFIRCEEVEYRRGCRGIRDKGILEPSQMSR